MYTSFSPAQEEGSFNCQLAIRWHREKEPSVRPNQCIFLIGHYSKYQRGSGPPAVECNHFNDTLNFFNSVGGSQVLSEAV